MNNDLYQYVQRLADNSLILSHRLSEYISRGPFLEEDLALTNTGLDLLGQAEALYKYAAEIHGNIDQDALAFGRLEEEYCNVHLVEYPNQDYGYVITRQFLMDVFNYSLFSQLKDSNDSTLAAIAQKSIKEITYHLKRSSEWIIRLGNGTEESHERIQSCVNNLWMYTDELFEVDEIDNVLLNEKIGADLSLVSKEWKEKVNTVLTEATLTVPNITKYSLEYGKQGVHTEYMGFLLADMQFMKNRFPEETW